MSLRHALLAATILALPLAAQAQPVTGLYVAGAAGLNWRQSTNTPFNSVEDGSGLFYAANLDASFETGWAALASVGWGFGNGLRAEIEGSYRHNGADSLVTSYPPVTSLGFTSRLTGVSGSAQTYALMANALYDIGATQGWPVHIVLGAGIGYGWHRWQGVRGIEDVETAIRINDTRGAFAYQAIAGLAIPIRSVPGLALTAEYRYFAMADTRQNGRYVWTPPQAGQETGVQNATRVNNQNQSLLLGVRYNFGQRPAAPPPVAAPAPARSFIVFFDFNRYDLTARAREIVAQAAAAARSQQVTRIEVAGHTDTVGSAQYNLGLSQRRANTVAAELVRLGVPREAIQTAGYGFSRPLVATGPNVREPQNRRVEIVFR